VIAAALAAAFLSSCASLLGSLQVTLQGNVMIGNQHDNQSSETPQESGTTERLDVSTRTADTLTEVIG